MAPCHPYCHEKGDLWIRVIGDKGSVVRYQELSEKGTVYQRSSLTRSRRSGLSSMRTTGPAKPVTSATTNRDHPVEAGDAEILVW